MLVLYFVYRVAHEKPSRALTKMIIIRKCNNVLLYYCSSYFLNSSYSHCLVGIYSLLVQQLWVTLQLFKPLVHPRSVWGTGFSCATALRCAMRCWYFSVLLKSSGKPQFLFTPIRITNRTIQIPLIQRWILRKQNKKLFTFHWLFEIMSLEENKDTMTVWYKDVLETKKLG